MGWPLTFEASMTHPILARIITMHARHVMKGSGRAQERRAEEWLPTEPPPDYRDVHMPVTGPMPFDPVSHVIDRKSLAAGEKPEADDSEL